MMKKLLLFFLLPSLLLSCSKPDDKALLNSVCEGLQGRYMCRSITFLGSPIDVNGDGISSTDLKSEFADIPNANIAINSEQRIFPARQYNEISYIDIEVPLQGVSYNKRNGEYYVDRSKPMYVVFSYTVSDDGTVSFGVHNDQNSSYYDEFDYEIVYVDNKYTHGDRIVNLGNGILTIIVNCAFYDCATGTFVKGQAEYVYERVSYSLY